MELKVAKKFREMEQAAKQGLNQIIEMQYPITFAEDGYQEVICYGIGFFRKQLRITMTTVNIEEYIYKIICGIIRGIMPFLVLKNDEYGTMSILMWKN